MEQIPPPLGGGNSSFCSIEILQIDYLKDYMANQLSTKFRVDGAYQGMGYDGVIDAYYTRAIVQQLMFQENHTQFMIQTYWSNGKLNRNYTPHNEDYYGDEGGPINHKRSRSDSMDSGGYVGSHGHQITNWLPVFKIL